MLPSLVFLVFLVRDLPRRCMSGCPLCVVTCLCVGSLTLPASWCGALPVRRAPSFVLRDGLPRVALPLYGGRALSRACSRLTLKHGHSAGEFADDRVQLIAQLDHHLGCIFGSFRFITPLELCREELV